MFDLVLFFHPKKELLAFLGIEGYVFFGEGGDGFLFEDSPPSYVRRFFSKNYKRFSLFGYQSRNRRRLLKVIREGLIDFVVKPPVDSTILKFIKTEGVRVVYPFKEIFENPAEEIVYLKELCSVCEKKKIPIILTSFSKDVYDLRSKFLLKGLLMELGFGDEFIKNVLEKNPREVYKVGSFRKKCSLPGVFYVEKKI